MKLLSSTMLAVALMVGAPVFAQDQAADNTQLLMEKVRADKKLLVANNMKLTEAEAKGFWPIYDAYQKELQQINGRLGKTIKAYAEAYNKGAVPDATAKQLLDEVLAVEEDELKQKRAVVPKLEKVMPMAKVARYMQIENKIRAAGWNEVAAGIPLVQ